MWSESWVKALMLLPSSMAAEISHAIRKIYQKKEVGKTKWKTKGELSYGSGSPTINYHPYSTSM